MNPYPDVPNAPGVPPVLRSPALANVEDTTILLTADAAIVIQAFQGPQWGIFDQTGTPVIVGDSVMAVDYRKEFRVADYPVEGGGFASYNKVQLPADIRLTFTCGGNLGVLGTILTGGALGAALTGADPSVAARTAFLGIA